MPWFALYTKPRFEKKVTERLEKMGIPVYCPMVTQLKQWSDRKKKVTVPVLPSYVFVQLDHQFRDTVFAVDGIVRYVYWLGQPAIIRDEEIQNLKDFLKNKIVTSFTVSSIQVGQNYTITSGPLQGIKGVVSRVDKNYLEIILEELGFKIQLHNTDFD
ncbi:UpxY family transcription antiterminator [Flavobacterium sp. j3]|uniref:UpxY family transcription antiterminator n=1 Tax=Flavobacterium aureirubrum TaxID=3133147 RepID=A0ABU9N641_9FLAO